jgi:hypothetical protein
MFTRRWWLKLLGCGAACLVVVPVPQFRELTDDEILFSLRLLGYAKTYSLAELDQIRYVVPYDHNHELYLTIAWGAQPVNHRALLDAWRTDPDVEESVHAHYSSSGGSCVCRFCLLGTSVL